jgi:hypothetical protein
MWLYPGPSCLDRSFSNELSEAKINTRIQNILDHGANLNPGAGPAPLREGVANARVSPLGSVLAVCVISYSHHVRDLMQGLRGTCSVLRGVILPVDTVKLEVNHARNE